ncbi:MAG: cyclopropane-fatty-acyl-phospholipid synthase [Frankiales bacterium]|nr:cyclopropane-fatty-acyl-phospholipid synthase [Frankiales bacterium]
MATQVAEVFHQIAGSDAPVRFTAYDGSTAGPADAEIKVEVVNPRAVTYLASAPGSLGFARAYIMGDLLLHGDVYQALRIFTNLSISDMGLGTKLELARKLGPLAVKRAPRPAEEARMTGRRHSQSRDAQAIAHHYNVSNRFYELVLGPSMAYTCAVYPTVSSTLEEAQFAKHDLVARKLGLEPGMRLLDVGCGWGGMVRHAAKEYGVKALGVTLSQSQAEYAQKRIADEGLSDLAEVRFLDYRKVAETGFDAVSAIGLAEHIGRAQMPAYFASLYEKVRPGGRFLNHCITRPKSTDKAIDKGGFIDRYVFPDGELTAAGPLATFMQDAGFEVRHLENLREHYGMTCAAWGVNLEANWAEAAAEVGEARARVWQLYLAGSRLNFERAEIELHQILGVKLDGENAHMPLRPNF